MPNRRKGRENGGGELSDQVRKRQTEIMWGEKGDQRLAQKRGIGKHNFSILRRHTESAAETHSFLNVPHSNHFLPDLPRSAIALQSLRRHRHISSLRLPSSIHAAVAAYSSESIQKVFWSTPSILERVPKTTTVRALPRRRYLCSNLSWFFQWFSILSKLNTS